MRYEIGEGDLQFQEKFLNFLYLYFHWYNQLIQC